jgi:coenzyme Q-binding protein COQ10
MAYRHSNVDRTHGRRASHDLAGTWINDSQQHQPVTVESFKVFTSTKPATAPNLILSVISGDLFATILHTLVCLLHMAGVKGPLPFATFAQLPRVFALKKPASISFAPQERSFIDSLLSSALGPCPLRSVSHTKTLPYSSKAIFKAISDVSGYPAFLPFTISSHVTDRDDAGYPTRARLRVGYDKLGLEENWDSIVSCNPGKGIVEARSSDNASQGLFETLQTRWEVDGLETAKPQTSVKLNVTVRFRNAVYDQMFAQVEQKVAGAMISAFEKRVQELDAAGR